MFLAELFQVKILKEGSTENTKIVWKSVFRIQNAGRQAFSFQIEDQSVLLWRVELQRLKMQILASLCSSLHVEHQQEESVPLLCPKGIRNHLFGDIKRPQK